MAVWKVQGRPDKWIKATLRQKYNGQRRPGSWCFADCGGKFKDPNFPTEGTNTNLLHYTEAMAEAAKAT
jgi:hypothetical protein